MGDLIRRLLIVCCLFATLLTACSFGGVFVEPTVPTGDTHVSETKQTFPTETGESPTEGATLQPESVPVTVPTETTRPVTVPPTAAPTETTRPATVPPTTTPAETTAPATVPPTIAPTETEPTSPTVPETDPPQPTNPVSGRHDPKHPENYSVSSGERALLDQIHTMRSRKNLPVLTEDSLLGGLAYLRASELTELFSHVRPDGRGYATVLTDYGYIDSASGETILKCEDWYPAGYILEDWLASKVTSDVLTDPAYTHVGVGILEENGQLYVVCLLTAK